MIGWLVIGWLVVGWLVVGWLVVNFIFLFKVRKLKWAPYILEIKREVILSFIPPKAKVLFQFRHWTFLIFFPCIFQIDYFSLVWTILGHFISFGPFLGHFISFGPFLGHFISFGPFLGHFIFNTLYGQGRGWSVCQFRYPSTLVYLIFYLFKS